jgi:hypothetical protein
MDTLPTPDLSIVQGTCYLLFAYDVARAIDLDQAEHHVVAMKQREVLKHGRRAPNILSISHLLCASLRMSPQWLSVTTAVVQVLTSCCTTSAPYPSSNTIPLRGPLSGLLTLSNDLYDATSSLLTRASMSSGFGGDWQRSLKPNIANFVEDYVIYHIEAFAVRHDIDDLCTRYAQDIAQILRAETQPCHSKRSRTHWRIASHSGRRRDDCRLECRTLGGPRR